MMGCISLIWGIDVCFRRVPQPFSFRKVYNEYQCQNLCELRGRSAPSPLESSGFLPLASQLNVQCFLKLLCAVHSILHVKVLFQGVRFSYAELAERPGSCKFYFASYLGHFRVSMRYRLTIKYAKTNSKLLIFEAIQK